MNDRAAAAMDLKPVEPTLAKVKGEVEVGEDIDFQRKWWRFERAAWIVFSLLVVLDVLGAFGRGAFAKATRRTADGAVEATYERIERRGAPSMLHVRLGASAIQNGKVRIFVTNSFVNELGGQRVIPQPESTAIGPSGLTYSFPAAAAPADVVFALQPPEPGWFVLGIGLAGSERMDLHVAVVP